MATPESMWQSLRMLVMNSLIIYDKINRHFTVTYGLWDQVRVDGGQEFN